MPSNNRPVILWLYTGCFIVFAMVVLGGITRLTGSGLSITEWKLINGTIPPLTEAAWQQEFENYKQIPQFEKINPHFELADFKSIYWWEYLHRLVGRILGIVFIVPFAWFWYKGMIDRKLMPKLIIMFLLGAWQGFLGWYMVKSGLIENVFVSHYRLAIHLINAFITFGFVFWVAQDLKYESNQSKNNSPQSFRNLALLTFCILIFQIIYGAFVAGLHAGHAYNTWPKMGDEWIASSVTMGWDKLGLMSLFDNIGTVQFIHRTVAIIVTILILILWLKKNSKLTSLNHIQKQAIDFCMLTVLLQFLLGVLTLIYNVPVVVAVLHQAGAFLLFMAMVHLLNRLKA